MTQEEVTIDQEMGGGPSDKIRQSFLLRYLKKVPGVSATIGGIQRLLQKHREFTKKHPLYRDILDFLLSNSVGRMLSIASAISIFIFSPLGIAFSIVIFCSTFISIGLGISADAFRIRAAKINTEKIRLINELQGIINQQAMQIEQLPNNQEAIIRAIGRHSNPSSSIRTFNPFRTLFKMITGKVPETTSTLVGTIISGNVISIVLGVTSSLYAAVSEGVYQKDLDKQNLNARNESNRILANLGIKGANGTNITALKAIQNAILKERCNLEVIKRIGIELGLQPNLDNTLVDRLMNEIKCSVLQESRALHVNNQFKVPGFFSCVGEALKRQFSAQWMSDAAECTTPLRTSIEGPKQLPVVTIHQETDMSRMMKDSGINKHRFSDSIGMRSAVKRHQKIVAPSSSAAPSVGAARG